ncbi:hypothetical protein GFS24_28465 [Chitinophaga sp. SYP-B3965]|uniref:hypothetical protein n=1 Tax=Chitinophaga sp. SYP-B3965 TaxID=2663120 RepID=UPI001299E8C0|nr:hypothetical protein [Chitinophaga sp. SYP-B3965]MRG49077.1 hypothetical protein [Chitinophaga sp. SYP-B3965]
MFNLDPWPQIVFIAAKGKMTVVQYVADCASKYTSAIPTALDETIIYELDQLLHEKLIAFSDTVDLDPLHDRPRN